MKHYTNALGFRVIFPEKPLTPDERAAACKLAGVRDVSTLRFGVLAAEVGEHGAGTPVVLWTQSDGDHVVTLDDDAAQADAIEKQPATDAGRALSKLVVDASPAVVDTAEEADPTTPETPKAEDVTPAVEAAPVDVAPAQLGGPVKVG